jgi:aspartate 1-decarboxylase
MLRTLMSGKVHRATVTEANLHYEGSITLDPDLIEAAGFLPYEQVHVLDVDNGARLVTYVIEGERGSGEVCINGAAAHLVGRGDLVIIVAYRQLTDAEAADFRPRVVFVDEQNRLAAATQGDGRSHNRALAGALA